MTGIHATETSDALMARIDTLLRQANENRRARTTGRAEAVGLVREVIDGKPWSFAHAGTVANAYKQSAVTTVALAARVDGRVYLGITTADAHGIPTPGRGWKALQPWGQAGPRGDAGVKWATWIGSPDVIEIGAGEIDAFLEAE